MTNVTLDSLAGMIQNQFGEVSKQFGEVSKRFDMVDQRLESIELKLSNVAYRFELQELEGKVSFLEKEMAQLKAKLK